MGLPQCTESQRFGLRFFGILILVSILSWAVALPRRVDPLQRAVARAAAELARLTGGHAEVRGTQVLVRALTIDVNFECTGVYVLLILFTFLLAYPASWRARTAGVLVGAVGLSLINVLRISLLIRVATVRPDLFDYLHEYVWQGIFLVLVVAYAMLWVGYARS